METSNKNIISQSQIEVWKWRNSIHEEINNMNIEDGLKYIIDKANKIKETTKIKHDNKLIA